MEDKHKKDEVDDSESESESESLSTICVDYFMEHKSIAQKTAFLDRLNEAHERHTTTHQLDSVGSLSLFIF